MNDLILIGIILLAIAVGGYMEKNLHRWNGGCREQ